jgi:hypothetical protein
VATIAHYGPTATRATKVVVSIFRSQKDEPDVLERWYSEGKDVRDDGEILDKILSLLILHAAKFIAMLNQIIGCPHEEGIDYPEGKSCPQCPYWAGRNRWSGERIQ